MHEAAMMMFGVLLMAVGAETANKPNILFILADDLGYGDVEVYPSPLEIRLKTPAVAQLASEGMIFLDAYAGYSVCAPSRRTLMTGYHTGHFDPDGSGPLLSNKSMTVAAMLRQQGYATRLIGKWGLDGNYKSPKPPAAGFPTLQGFEGFFGQSDQWQCHDYYPPFMFNTTENGTALNTTISANEGASVAKCGHDHKNCVWSGDLWTQNAIDWITERVSGSPWFLYLAYTSPHAGSVGSVGEDDVPGPRVDSGPYVHETWPPIEINFATTVTDVDTAVSHVVDAVDSSGQAESTIIFFSSDNGAHQEGGHQYQFFNSSGYLNGFKRSIHDGGHRAAFIVRWKDTIPAGTVSRHQLCFYDFLPTAAELAGCQHLVPSTVDGHSFLPTLLGKQQDQPDFIYHEYTSPNDPGFAGKTFPKEFGQNIRMGNWSGVCVGPSRPCTGTVVPGYAGAFFLYDMSVDQGQTNNIADKYPATVEKIREIMIREWNYSYDPAMPSHVPTPPPVPNPAPNPMKGPCRATFGVLEHWWGGRGNPYTMLVAPDGMSVTLHTTNGCCAWKSAVGAIHQGTIQVTAMDAANKTVLENIGNFSFDGCHISWTKRWAPWTRTTSG